MENKDFQSIPRYYFPLRSIYICGKSVGETGDTSPIFSFYLFHFLSKRSAFVIFTFCASSFFINGILLLIHFRGKGFLTRGSKTLNPRTG